MKNSSKFVLTLLGAILSQNIFANEDSTASHFSKLLEQKNHAELTQFLNQMPKGGDLHHHFSGSLYFEDYINFLKASNDQRFCIVKIDEIKLGERNFKKFTIIDKYKDEFKNLKSQLDNKNCLPIVELQLEKNKNFYTDMINKWSQLDYFNHYHDQETPYNHFFNTFPYFSEFAKEYTFEGLKKIVNRAKVENVSYIETMLEGSEYIRDDENLNPKYLFLKKDIDALKCIENNCSNIEKKIKNIILDLEKDEDFLKKINYQSDKVNSLAKRLDNPIVKIKFQTYATRNKKPLEVISGIYSAFKLASINSNVVAVNFVSTEHSPYSMENYSLHMEFFKILKQKYPNVKIALHAGELTLGLVEPEKLTSNIEYALKTGAQRIGHGVSIGYEDPSVLQELKAKDIAVEINLTSNEVILGVKDEHHPIKLYQKAKVPFVISTDDSGVSRNNLTNEYFKFSTRYQPDYRTLKNTVYASINYSFLNEFEKSQLKNNLDEKFKKFENKF